FIVTPGGGGELRTIFAALSASCFVAKTTIDKPFVSAPPVQYPLTKPGALLTRGTTCSRSDLRAISSCPGSIVTLTTTACMGPPSTLQDGRIEETMLRSCNPAILQFHRQTYLLIGIMMCAPGVPASISHGRPSPPIDSSRRLPSDTPIDSGVAPGTDSTHSNWIRSCLP